MGQLQTIFIGLSVKDSRCSKHTDMTSYSGKGIYEVSINEFPHLLQ